MSKTTQKHLVFSEYLFQFISNWIRIYYSTEQQKKKTKTLDKTNKNNKINWQKRELESKASRMRLRDEYVNEADSCSHHSQLYIRIPYVFFRHVTTHININVYFDKC